MHRYLSRFIACLVLSLALALMQFVGPRHGRKEISVRTDGQTADIVAAVEALKRKDVTVKVEDDLWATSPVGGIVFGSLALAGLLWLSSGVVKRIETKIVEASSKK